ncbi:MAG: phosphatase PAP2 family protein [Bacteroidales bacterium]
MLDSLIEFDKQLLLAINGWNNCFLDSIMVCITNKYAGIPIYALIMFMIFYKRNIKGALIIFFAVITTFALCDSLSVALFKDVFQRLRPCYNPTTEHLVRMLEYKGGHYGFVSSHAANLFGLAAISSAFFKKRWFTILVFVWAILVGYSRVYVGKHFPLDVICGAIFGLLIGYFVYFIASKLKTKILK